MVFTNKIHLYNFTKNGCLNSDLLHKIIKNRLKLFKYKNLNLYLFDKHMKCMNSIRII